MNQPFSIGQRVRPFGDGEDSNGNIIKWTKVRGEVVDIWMDGEGQFSEWRVEVKWDDRVMDKQYGTRMPAYLLSPIQ